MEIIMSILAFLIVIALLITLHEWGHFSVARWTGVKVLRFSIGLGKPIVRWYDRLGTEYVVAAFPIGGYVKLLDEQEGNVSPQDKPYAFNRQPPWKKMLITAAGPLYNFLFAFIAYWVLFCAGVETLVPVVGKVVAGSPASLASLQKGDEIITVNDQLTPGWQEVSWTVLSALPQATITMQVRGSSSSQLITKTLRIPSQVLENAGDDILLTLGIAPYLPVIPPKVGNVIPGEAAAMGGMQKGDILLTVNGLPIEDWNVFVDFVRTQPNQDLLVRVERNKTPIELHLHTRAQTGAGGKEIGYLGIISERFIWPKQFVREHVYSPWEAVSPAFRKSVEIGKMTLIMLGKMILGEVSLANISGPIGIAQGAGESLSLGWKPYLNYLAIISISLGILNLLPIPVLDGGRFVYYLIEAVFRRPLPQIVQDIGMQLGVLFLIALLLLAFYNDISRLH